MGRALQVSTIPCPQLGLVKSCGSFLPCVLSLSAPPPKQKEVSVMEELGTRQ